MNRYQEAAQYACKRDVRGCIKIEVWHNFVSVIAKEGDWLYEIINIPYEQIDTAPENPLITAIDELIKEVEE